MIRRTRVLCLECEGTRGNSVDFCQNPSCFSSGNVIARRTDVAHLPSHLLLKTRDVLLIKDYYSVKMKAIQRFKEAKALAPSLVEESSLSAPSTPHFLDDNISLPPHLLIASVLSQDPDQIGSNDSSTLTSRALDEDVISNEDCSKIQRVKCLVCHKRVVAPCWHCIDCDSKSCVHLE